MSQTMSKSNPNFKRMLLCGAAVIAGVFLWHGKAYSFSTQDAVQLPAPTQDEAPGNKHIETAVFSGGCFWGVQGVFQHVQGVQNVVSGYTGGNAGSATYDMVSSGSTGHAESVQITFDPSKVSYGTLLQIFFSVAHDPTQLNRQSPDSGTQYRSAVWTTSASQQQVVKAYIAQLDATHRFARPIVTQVNGLSGFYAAEGYHQNFLTLHPDNGYIVVNDLPKVSQLKRLFPTRYNEQPVLVQGV